MKGFKRILYPVALTDISPGVAAYVVAMARQFDADVYLLHVLRRFDWFVDTYVSQPEEPDFKRIASDFEGQVQKQAEAKLARFVQRHLEGVRIVEAAVVSGTRYKEILSFVEKKEIDLIIMGTGSGLQRALFGSVAEKVSHLASVPVMLIKNAPEK
jgi:nucleotide-binding universal stress UspA family protein